MLIVVTNRRLCREDFLRRLQKIADAGPELIILREKDLEEDGFRELARRCSRVCRAAGVPLSLNTHWQTARELGIPAVHLPLPELIRSEGRRERFQTLGVSVHSLEEALSAQEHGATYLTAGHIFETGCKPGTPGRGLSFLNEVCTAVSLPVYAIGGITPQRAGKAVQAGARGVCVMSELMTCENPGEVIRAYRMALSLDNAGEKG